MPQIDADHHRAAHRGDAQGGSAERFEPPLAGGAAALMCASAFCWHTACQRRGGNPPAPAFPRRGKREKGCSEFLVAAGSSRWHSANVRHAAGLLCARSCSTFLSIPINQSISRSARFAFPKSCWRHPTPLPCFYPHSEWAAMGPVHVGVRSQAQVHHHRDGPGLLGAAIFTAISAKDQWG
jgi:hypothetical protein